MKPTNKPDPHDILDQLLPAAVREATGRPDVEPRPGQVELSHEVLDRMLAVGEPSRSASDVATQSLAGAPTGSGKSLAYLAPLFLEAATSGRRGVVSTESLSLQSQVVDKDAPAVARAVEKVLGKDAPSFAMLKGWSNYGCASRAAGTAAQLLGLSEEAQSPGTMKNLVAALDAQIAKGDEDPVVVDDREYDSATLLPLARWVLDSAEAMDATGDRDSYPGNRGPTDWQQVSVTPDDCVGADKCSFAAVCLPKKAQDEASVADVVVTNHAMLAVQAANNVPVVLGNNRLGIFDHLVIDEAHALPAIVRGAGARSISASTVMRLVRVIHRHCATSESAAPGEKVDREADQLVQLGESLALSVDQVLDRKIGELRRKSRHGAAVMGVDPDDKEPLGRLGDSLAAWAKQVARVLPADNPIAPLPPTQAIALKRARADVTRFASDLTTVLTHEVGHARWIQDGDSKGRGRWMGASLRSSPVDVAGDISANLFTADVVKDRDDDSNPWNQVPEHRWVSDEDAENKRPPRYRLSATAVSATLPKSFAFDTGMAVKAKPYPSPFMDAYEGSALYIPMVKDLDDAAGFTRTWPGARKPSFDTGAHPEWAVGQIVKLVSANGGRALLLAATVSAGQRYAETLRVMMPGLTVFSQWDGRPVRHVLAEWRADETSVMVGTKSLMTGVDAPGQTCSLVILDRVPRDAGNPVDDARVEAVMERGGMDRWGADRHVYVADAALRIDQASGRLIRAGSDRGMFALLDPRMLKFGVVTYAEPSRKALMEPLQDFGTKVARLDQALDWLGAHRRASDGSSPLAS
ncbi:ATP-dependent DNA helicase [Ornithinimicrobium murale]|uniref:ATP-dependent DNA helicase n=1 Tax=Ornithinimicrobium murale TaxID=1050153 RepID=UPI000E0DDEA4|nr:ATP-dependent DNA helicase [Ornithinimicrobium murale]